jgi:hypothetical protein
LIAIHTGLASCFAFITRVLLKQLSIIPEPFLAKTSKITSWRSVFTQACQTLKFIFATFAFFEAGLTRILINWLSFTPIA